jgi:hypothetical protein
MMLPVLGSAPVNAARSWLSTQLGVRSPAVVVPLASGPSLGEVVGVVLATSPRRLAMELPVGGRVTEPGGDARGGGNDGTTGSEPGYEPEPEEPARPQAAPRTRVRHKTISREAVTQARTPKLLRWFAGANLRLAVYR